MSKQQASAWAQCALVTSHGGPVGTTPVELDEVLLLEVVVVVLVTDEEPAPPAPLLLVAPGRTVPVVADVVVEVAPVEN